MDRYGDNVGVDKILAETAGEREVWGSQTYTRADTEFIHALNQIGEAASVIKERSYDDDVYWQEHDKYVAALIEYERATRTVVQ